MPPLLRGRSTVDVRRSLAEPDRAELRELLRARLPTGPDGAIRLTARAWAVRGTAPTPRS
ncbi:hypothetical protein M2302_002456 [Micromonospora sp. A200]|nr:hypothetical protein [Micromonospora sp. A200]